MKILRKFLVFILGFILVNLFGCLVISFSLKEILQNNILSTVVKETVVESFSEEMGISQEQQDELKKAINNEEVDKIVSDIVEEMMTALSDENAQFDTQVIDKLFDHVIENKEVIEKAVGTEIDVTMFEELRKSDEYKQLTEEISETFNESSQSLDSESKSVIQIYSFITSSNFKLILVVLMVVDILLIMLVQWSLYEWLKILGRAMVTAGITLFALSFLVDYIIADVLSENNITVNMNLNNLFVTSIISLVVGLILIILRKIIANYIVIKNNKEVEVNEVSAIPTE